MNFLVFVGWQIYQWEGSQESRQIEGIGYFCDLEGRGGDGRNVRVGRVVKAGVVDVGGWRWREQGSRVGERGLDYIELTQCICNRQARSHNTRLAILGSNHANAYEQRRPMIGVYCTWAHSNMIFGSDRRWIRLDSQIDHHHCQ